MCLAPSTKTISPTVTSEPLQVPLGSNLGEPVNPVILTVYNPPPREVTEDTLPKPANCSLTDCAVS